MDLNQYLANGAARVEARLRELTTGDAGPFHLVKEAMEYSLFAGGKRIRPILCMAACEACGGDEDVALTIGSALEMIHTYTLIHDDLPAMDNDDLRRGRPSNHVVYGEAQALLAGCGLLTWAYEVLTLPARQGRIPAATALRLIAETSQAIGWQGTMGGQSLDMIFTQRGHSTRDELQFMEQAKTGKLIVTAIRDGALAAGADEPAVERLTRFGDLIGLAFQVADDILDVVAEEGKLGKPIGSDLRQGKTTWVDHLGLDEARRYLQSLLAEALNAIESFDDKAAHLRGLAHFIVERAY